MGIRNKVVLISGAGSGLGAATAVSFAKEGALVVLCGRRNEKIQAVRQKIEDEGGKAIAIQADVSIESDVKRLVEQSIQQFGGIDILINNAGVFEPGLVIETTLESWDYQLRNNLTSAFLLTRACLPMMRKKGQGVIINITSSLAQNGSGGFAAYSASKAGLESLTKTTAEDESEHGIRAHLFNPGAIKTGMHATGGDPYSVIPGLLKLINS